MRRRAEDRRALPAIHGPITRATYEPLGRCGSRHCDADRARCGLRLERLPDSAYAGLWMEYLAGYLHFRIGDTHARFCRFRGRSVDEASRSAPNRGDRRTWLRAGCDIGRASARTPRITLSYVWSLGRLWFG